MIDEERFRSARTRVIAEESFSEGIGTLAEKSMHKIIKLYYEPNEEKHEVKILGSVADVVNENGIFEIQTGGVGPLLSKIKKYLREYPVTIVHPIVVNKTLRWLDKETGELTEPRKSPGKKTIHSLSFELYKLRGFVGTPGFSVILLMLSCEEYRRLDGWDSTRKKGATKIESIPVAILDEIVLTRHEDYRIFLPKELPDRFLAQDFNRAIKSRSRYDYYTLRLLCELGILKKAGKKGKAIIYARC